MLATIPLSGRQSTPTGHSLLAQRGPYSQPNLHDLQVATDVGFGALFQIWVFLFHVWEV